MSICENCNVEIFERYGSGRFCSSKCARGFSTKSKRAEINLKVSKALVGKSHPGYPQSEETKAKRRNSWTDAHRAKSSQRRKEKALEQYLNTPFHVMKKHNRKRFVLEEQLGKCLFCGLSEWLGQPMKFELDHIDGDNTNNDRSNLRCLCPNCHSMTPTWRKPKIGLVV